MKTIKSKHVRKTIQHDPGVDIVEHSYVRADEDSDTVKKIDQETDNSQNRPYPTLPESANPDDPPAKALKE